MNPTRFTAPSTGYYLAVCSMQFSSSVTFQMNLEVNGATPTPTAAVVATTGNSFNTAATVTQILSLSANDYVQCFIFGASTASTTANESMMSLTKLSTTF